MRGQDDTAAAKCFRLDDVLDVQMHRCRVRRCTPPSELPGFVQTLTRRGNYDDHRSRRAATASPPAPLVHLRISGPVCKLWRNCSQHGVLRTVRVLGRRVGSKSPAHASPVRRIHHRDVAATRPEERCIFREAAALTEHDGADPASACRPGPRNRTSTITPERGIPSEALPA